MVKGKRDYLGSVSWGFGALRGGPRVEDGLLRVSGYRLRQTLLRAILPQDGLTLGTLSVV